MPQPRSTQLPGNDGPPPQQPIVEALEGAVGLAAGQEPPSVPRVADLVTFVGFSGPTVVQPGGKNFLLFYLDPAQQSWMLVEQDQIRYHQEIKDDSAPRGRRMMIWVSVDAAVGSGSGPQSDEARFLTGEFTRAGDFSASPMSGTMGAVTGVFCEARSPSCCYGRSRP